MGGGQRWIWWGLFAIWTALLGYSQYQSIARDEFWAGVSIRWDKALPILVAFAVFAGTQLFVRRSRQVARHALVLSTALVVVVLALGEPLSLSLHFVLFAGASLLVGEGGRWLLARAGLGDTPFWLGWLLGMAVLQYPLFALASAGLLSKVACFACVMGVAGLGVLQLVRRSARSWVTELVALEFRKSEGLLLFAVVIVLLLSFVAGSLPQTYTDGLVYRLPYLQALVREAAIPEHHDLWVWAIPQPGILQMAPGYFAFGEVGAAWTVLAMFAALALVSYDFALRLSGSRGLALLATLLIVSLPPAWVVSTAIYTDIPIAVYTLGGLALVARALGGGEARASSSARWLLPSAALLGFAASIKVNAPIVIVLALGLLLLLTKAAWRVLLSRPGLLAILVGISFAAPWYLWTFIQTGNPFFPFLNSVFPTKLETATIFTDEARSQFAFEPSLLSYLRLPWDLSFATSRFGSFPNASFGPWALLLSPLLLVAIVRRFARPRELGVSLALLLAPAVAFFLTSAFLGISVFRYSLAGYMLALVAAAGLAGPFARSVRFAGAFAVLPVLFLVLIGSRTNYLVDGGIGDEVYLGERSREEFIEAHTHGIPVYVDANIGEGETLFTSMFFFVNRFDAHAYHISTEASLLGKVATLEQVRRYIEKHDVRYWVMNRATPPDYLVKQGIFDSLLTEERIVYGAGSYAVYDLRSSAPVLRTVELGPRLWIQHDPPLAGRVRVTAAASTHASCELSLETGEGFVRGYVDAEAELDSAVVLLHLVFRDANGNILGRKVADGTLGGERRQLCFYAPVAEGASSLQLILQPWREIDGQIELARASLQTLR